jgi:hypothetical protein
MITYDLHADPFFQGWTLDQRRNAYYQWRDNAQWLLDFLEPFGGNVTFLSAGEFMEFVLEDENQSVTFLKRMDIANGARPEIVATNDRVFVVYLSPAPGANSFKVAVFDRELNNEIASQTLVSTTSQYGMPTDIRVARDGEFLYAFYETVDLPNNKTYLWGAKYSLTDSFDRINYTSTPITQSLPAINMGELPDGTELVDDPAPLIGPNSTFVITRIKYALNQTGQTIYRVREFSKDLQTKLSEFDLNLSSVADGRARVASVFYHNYSYYMALPTTTGPVLFEEIDLMAYSDILMVRLGTNWQIQESRMISQEPDDSESYVSGFKINGSYFYLTYNQLKFSQEWNSVLKIYDMDFNLVWTEIVKSITPEPGARLRPSLEIAEDRILLGNSNGNGTGEVYVYLPRVNAISLMRRLYENGGSLGTHSHTEIYAGPHDWPSLGYNATEEQARQNWDDAIRFVDAVVAEVIGTNDTTAIASVNNIRGGHLPNNRADFYKFMIEYGFPIQEGGAGEPWYQYFGHYIWNPFRPARESPWMENLSTPFVYVPSGPVIGKKGVHAGVYQDFSLPNAKKMFLMLYLNWRHHETSPDSYRVWTFGWASHNHDISPGSQTRLDVEEFVRWLNATFVSRRSASGNVIAKWAGRKEVYDAYLDWENTHPNQSSFNYPVNVKDYNHYPYLKAVQQTLEKAYYVTEVTSFSHQGVNAHRLVSTETWRPIYVLWKDNGTATVDLSSEFNETVKVTASVSGNVILSEPNAIEVGSEAIIVEEVAGQAPVGGIWSPVDKLELLAPYIGLTILVAIAVTTIVYVKKRKHMARLNETTNIETSSLETVRVRDLKCFTKICSVIA